MAENKLDQAGQARRVHLTQSSRLIQFTNWRSASKCICLYIAAESQSREQSKSAENKLDQAQARRVLLTHSLGLIQVSNCSSASPAAPRSFEIEANPEASAHTMVDALSVVQLIVSLVVAIKGAVDTVKQSKQDCQEIAARVSTLDADLSSLDNTAAMKHPVVCSALEGLHLALHQALQVVVDCQEERTIFRHANAEKLSQRLRQANQNITDQMIRVILVASLQSNIVLNTQHSQHGVVQSLPQQYLSQEGYLVNSHEREESAPVSSCFKTFSLSELMVATDNFSEENVIGESTSSTVYKGKLRNGSEVAVKSYSKEQHRALRKQCENEEHVAAKLLHKNIVEFQGYCSSGERFCQVYEYMPNRSLSAYIHGDRREWKLSWTKRFNIIKGIAWGVVYLHDLCGLHIIHLHLRPSNILLDHSFTPKICDFGISEMLPESVDERTVGFLTGTCTFRAPEYVRHNGRFSVKISVQLWHSPP